MKSNRFDWTPTDMAHPIPVILDGDPGHDDALAWMIAAEPPLLKAQEVLWLCQNTAVPAKSWLKK